MKASKQLESLLEDTEVKTWTLYNHYLGTYTFKGTYEKAMERVMQDQIVFGSGGMSVDKSVLSIGTPKKIK